MICYREKYVNCERTPNMVSVQRRDPSRKFSLPTKMCFTMLISISQHDT